MDAYAVDEKGKLYNIEIQKDDKGATGKRARYNGSLMDLDFLKKGTDFENLPARYVIINSQNGYNCYGEPIQEFVYTSKSGKLLDDETNIVYVNGKNKDNTDLGKLMQDLNNKYYETMNYKSLADKVRYYKTTEKGQETMNEKLKELMNEKLKELMNKELYNRNISIISNMLKLKLEPAQIKIALNLSDTDYNAMYPIALKLAQ